MASTGIYQMFISVTFCILSFCTLPFIPQEELALNFPQITRSQLPPFRVPQNTPSHLSEMLVYCGQTARWIKIPLGTEVSLGPGHIVLDGDAALVPKGAQSQFSAHACCGQAAGWMKMPLGVEVGLSPGDIVLDPACP